jgi:hypothetical protein
MIRPELTGIRAFSTAETVPNVLGGIHQSLVSFRDKHIVGGLDLEIEVDPGFHSRSLVNFQFYFDLQVR